ncbi:MAG: threonine--tRNA ligase [Candidatus Nanoarchaeia archaeon]
MSKPKENSNIEMIRHSLSHILAQAVKELYPKVKFGIGPAIENGFYYDFDNLELTEQDLKKIEDKMKEIIKKNIKIEHKLLSRDEAKKILKEQKYKLELLNALEDKKISFYEQGNFIDMCIGPHVESTGKINTKAFKLTHIADAYWKGSSENQMLKRIYGIAFESEKDLNNYLKQLEEAEKRDHRKIGREQELFMTHELALPGSPFFLAKGAIIYNELMKFIREEYKKRDYKEVITPLLYKKKLWETSGHWEHYKDDMFCMKIGNEEYSLKPMNCPSHCLIYKNRIRSYRDLPLRIADFACLHRNELGGVLGGLTRVTKFSQDDAHIFCTEEQIMSEIEELLEFVKYIYKIFKMEYTANLSTRPEKFMGEKSQWDKAEKALKEALEKNKIKYQIKNGEGAFYGPKIDFDLKDVLGRNWQLPTIQLDFQMPGRFELAYEGSDGKKHTPVMIHRAILGSLERFIGVIIEHYAGKFPLWLSPVQIKVLSLSQNNMKTTEKITLELKDKGFRVESDIRDCTVQAKIRDAELERINYVIVIGDKEEQNKTLAIRPRGDKPKFGVKIEDFVKQLENEIKEKI